MTGVTAVNDKRANNRATYVLVKDRKGSPRKIDGAVAAVLAHEAARDAHAARLWARARRRGRRTGRLIALTD